MKNLSFFCLTLNPNHEKKILDLGYIPVGLGNKIFSENFFKDKDQNNIAHKNPYYGEYTFHYWLWKNYINEINTEWVGFCQYRKFFVQNVNVNLEKFESLKKNIITHIPENLNNFDCILSEQFSVENFKFIKFAKKNFFNIISNPSVLFSEKKRTIKFHFDTFHGSGNLDLAINLLDKENKKDFSEFVNNRTSFNQHNMFICKTKYLKKYYDSVIPWLERCESVFGFKELKGYGLKRIYGFLAERYLSYWFLKNYQVKELPIIVKDLTDYKNL